MNDELPLRILTPADLPQAMELKRFARWNQTERDWEGYLEFEPGGCFAAVDEGKVIGTATSISYGDRFGWIGMVLVHPDARRRGAGRRLLLRTIAYLQARGVRGVKLDATEMGMKVYVPLGFRTEYRVTRYEAVARAGSSGTAVAVSPMTEADLPGAAELDTPAFGAPRAGVLRSMLARNPDFNGVVRDADGVRGYLIAREGENAVQVGPWVARDAACAAALLDRLLARISGRPVFVDVPEPNAGGVSLVLERGFAVQRGFARMFLGENPFPGQPERVFGTSGAEKG